MKKMIYGMTTAAMLTSLISCSGGGSSSASGSGAALTGTAAVGAPIVGGSVFLVDSAGNTGTTVTTNESGEYTISVSGLTAPFLIKVVSTDGQAFVSAASAQDVASSKPVNVSPLTHIIVSNVLGNADAEQAFESFASNASKVTSGAVEAQKTSLVAKLKTAGIYSGLGVGSDIDLMNGTLNAGSGEGIDKVLDALKIDISATKVKIASKANPSDSFEDDVADDANDVPPPTFDSAAMNETVGLVKKMKTTISQFAALYASLDGSVTSDAGKTAQKNTIKQMLHPDYLHRGMNREEGAWYEICDWDSVRPTSLATCATLDSDASNVEISNVNIEEMVDGDSDGSFDGSSDHIVASFNLKWTDSDGKTGFEKETISVRYDATDGKYKELGNQSKYGIELQALSKKSLDVTFNTTSMTSSNTAYTAGFQLYLDSGFPQDTNIEISGPGILDGSTAAVMSYDASHGTHVFAEYAYLDASGQPTNLAGAAQWDGTCSPGCPKQNWEANLHPVTAGSVGSMNAINEYTIVYKKTNGDADGSYTDRASRPVVLSASNESSYLASVANAEDFCTAPQFSANITVPSGIEVDAAGLNYYMIESLNYNNTYSVDYMNQNLDLSAGSHALSLSYSKNGTPGYNAVPVNDSVLNFNGWFWHSDSFERSYQLSINCRFEP